MGASNRAVTLGLGMQTVTAASFGLSKDGTIVLAGLARTELLPDPAADASRAGQLKIALAELRTKIPQGSAACGMAIPSQRIFTRFVKIPQVAPDQAAQMLSFEAQQNVPHPMEEVTWSYQILPESDPEKLGAIILATKLEDLEPTVESVRSAGYAPEIIEAAPAALYNALRYNYPELIGCTLLIDIGARTTNLLFCENQRLFVRTLPTGGNSITADIHKRLQGQPMAAAEALKLSDAFIPPPGNHDLQSGAETGKTARMVMTRIHNEIARSVTFYRTNHQGTAPMRVFIAGGGASMPGTLEFFNEKLSLPVEFFNPVRRVSVAGTADAELVRRSAHTLGDCVGLAARLLIGDCPLQVDFQSPVLRSEVRDKQRRPYLAAAVALLAGAFALSYTYFATVSSALDKSNDDLQKKIQPLQQLKGQIDDLAGEREKLLQNSSDIASSPLLRTAWADILNEVSSRMPERNIWITSLRPMAGDTIVGDALKTASAQPTDPQPSGTSAGPVAITALAIDGLYLQNEGDDPSLGPAVVDQFVDALSQSSLLAIDAAKKTEVLKQRTAQDGKSWAYDYQLVIPLKRPIPLR